MTDAKRKLHNQDGQSILMAMLLLLVAVIVSVVVITAATSAAHQINDNRKAQQSYLTVSSAAELFKLGLQDKTYTYTVISYVCKSGAEVPRADDTSETIPDSVLQSFLLETSRLIRDAQEDTAPLLMQKKAEINADNLKPVSAEMRLDLQQSGGWQLLIKLNQKESADDGDGYKMEMRIPITKSSQVLSGGDITAVNEDGTQTVYEVIRQTTQIQWDKAEITKGWTDDEQA